MLKLTKTQYKKIIEHATAHLPNEACGLLAGTVMDDIFTVKKIYCLTNLDASPTHFRINPKEQFEAARDMRLSGLILLGNFHSHPKSMAVPSGEDWRLAFDNRISSLILSLMGPVPVLRSFKMDGQIVTEEEVMII